MLPLRFIGELGVYLPDRDAIRVFALDSNYQVECYATRSALEELGCRSNDAIEEQLRQFERNREIIELAAMVKYRRALCRMPALEIGREDIRLPKAR
jgi:hypothetical protein